MGDEEIWSPANRVAELFLGTTKTVAKGWRWEFRIMGGGVLAVSIGLLDRAGVEIRARNEGYRVDVLRGLMENPPGRSDRAGVPIETSNEAERKAVAELRDATY